ncbi:MAG: hypothetical protein WC812_00035 [Candidatus Pacearchaeota archaeon]|jgi:hypothetical protein
MNNEIKKLEIAKSYFVLAQISIIFAGFLFASGGIAYNSANNNFDKAVSLALNSENLTMEKTDLYKNFIQIYGNLTNNNLQLWIWFFIIGAIFVLISFILWFIGNNNIKKI